MEDSVELSEITGNCIIICKTKPFCNEGASNIELIKSGIITDGNYVVFLDRDFVHFGCHINIYYIKSIQHEFDDHSTTIAMSQRPLFNYIKPNNVYFI